MRLLFILTEMSDRLKNVPDSKAPTHKFIGELKLMKLDFYVRYPDYLANQLIDEFQSNQDTNCLKMAHEIMNGEEPDIRTILMVRWRYGAYEKIETALAILEAPGLIKAVRDVRAPGKPWSYLIFPSAFHVAMDAVAQEPTLTWYLRQIEAIKLLPRMSGSELKDAQYSVPEYENAAIGKQIPRIGEKVTERLEAYNV